MHLHRIKKVEKKTIENTFRVGPISMNLDSFTLIYMAVSLNRPVYAILNQNIEALKPKEFNACRMPILAVMSIYLLTPDKYFIIYNTP